MHYTEHNVRSNLCTTISPLYQSNKHQDTCDYTSLHSSFVEEA